MTLRGRERGGLWKVGYTTIASDQKSSLRGAVSFKEKLIRLNGYHKPYPMVVHTSVLSQWPPRGDLDSSSPFL